MTNALAPASGVSRERPSEANDKQRMTNDRPDETVVHRPSSIVHRHPTLWVAVASFLLAALFARVPLSHLNDGAVGGDIDGYNNIWDYYWLKTALLDLHRNPYFTDYIYYPTGISLRFHTFNPINGLLTMPFNLTLGYIPTFNLLFFFAPALTLLFSFLLIRDWVRNPWAAFAGAVIAAYGDYHVAVFLTAGQSSYITLQWIPLYFFFLFRAVRGTPLWNATDEPHGFDTRRWPALLGPLHPHSLTHYPHRLAVPDARGLRHPPLWPFRALHLAVPGVTRASSSHGSLQSAASIQPSWLSPPPAHDQGGRRQPLARRKLPELVPLGRHPLALLPRHRAARHGRARACPGRPVGNIQGRWIRSPGRYLLAAHRSLLLPHVPWPRPCSPRPIHRHPPPIQPPPKAPRNQLRPRPGPLHPHRHNRHERPLRFRRQRCLGGSEQQSTGSDSAAPSTAFRLLPSALRPALAVALVSAAPVGAALAESGRARIDPPLFPAFYQQLAQDKESYAILELPIFSDAGLGADHYQMYQLLHGKFRFSGRLARDRKLTNPDNFVKTASLFDHLWLLSTPHDYRDLFYPKEDFLQRTDYATQGLAILNYYKVRYIILYKDALAATGPDWDEQDFQR